MSYPYAGSATFHATITLPDDGDPASAASVDSPFQDVADRTVWCKDEIDDLNAVVAYGVTHCAPNVINSGTLSWTNLGATFVNPDAGAALVATVTAQASDIVDLAFNFSGVFTHAGGGPDHYGLIELYLAEFGGATFDMGAGYIRTPYAVPSGDTFYTSGTISLRHVMTGTGPLSVFVRARSTVASDLALDIFPPYSCAATVYRARP
jgi:hypothetical protein